MARPDPTRPEPHPVIDSPRFNECLWVLGRRATPDLAGDRLRAHIRVIKDEWESGGHHQDRAVHLLIEALLIELSNTPGVDGG